MIELLVFALAPWSTQGVTSRFRPLPPEAAPTTDAAPAETPHTGTLPYANGRTFADLDSYLAHRRALGAIDLPWYEEVAPGVYELRTSMRPAPPRKRVTRAELARQFGFAG